MEVILNESIEKLGKAGDIVKVADGYGRNYLLPYGFAMPADKKNLVKLEKQRQAIIARAAKIAEEYEALAAKLADIDITCRVKVGEDNKLFGSVTSRDIAAIIEKAGYEVDRRKIQLAEPIKAVGEYDLDVKVHPDVTARIKVKVVPEGEMDEGGKEELDAVSQPDQA